AQALMAIEASALWWLVWSGNITMGWLLALATIHGTLAAVEIPSRQALIVELVGRDDLLDAIALNSSGFNLARIIGPSAAAIVIARCGIAACFALNAVSYAAVLIGLLRIRLPKREIPRPTTNPFEG